MLLAFLLVMAMQRAKLKPSITHRYFKAMPSVCSYACLCYLQEDTMQRLMSLTYDLDRKTP